MEGIIKLSIMTPDREFHNDNVLEVNTENKYGRLSILKNHLSMITIIIPTVTHFKQLDGKELKVFTSTGILKVEENNVTILCDAYEWPDEIDINRAEESKKRAEMRLKESHGIDYKRAEIALVRALTRLKTKGN